MTHLFVVWQRPKRAHAANYNSALALVVAKNARDAVRVARERFPDDIGDNKDFESPKAALAHDGFSLSL